MLASRSCKYGRAIAMAGAVAFAFARSDSIAIARADLTRRRPLRLREDSDEADRPPAGIPKQSLADRPLTAPGRIRWARPSPPASPPPAACAPRRSNILSDYGK
jgi:hypothetical protein